jgi:hypothetical protein
MQQMSLWDMPQEEQPTPQYIPVPAMGETMKWQHPGWADGDTRPESLKWLARSLLEPGWRSLQSFKATNGMSVSFRVIATRIEGDHVMMTLKRIEPPIKGYVDWLREQGQPVPDNGDDE